MSLQARGLALEMDDALKGIVTLGWLEADGLNGEPLGEAFEQERDATIRELMRRIAGRAAADLPGVAETRSMFHRLGVDPTKSRPASEALLRRVLQGKGLPVIHPAVDVCNLASLEHQLPIGLYDRAHLKGTIVARLGRPGEHYEGIRKGAVNVAGRPMLADDEGAFGAPTSDSARTQVTEATRSLLAVIYCPVDRPGDHLSAMLARVADLLARHCGATVHIVQTRQ
ncbi:MAG TPA: phenylalanine--tRNA ligase beta subunit-related protein [Verrucomicrobiae bacterium]|nr:phenylalanine--tRNA ligase beta subunit-related protein [Verrucomicrobiae bacterium]